MRGDTAEAVVAGHICLDFIPSLPGNRDPVRYEPGTLVEVGPMTVAAGGSVSNTGTVLHRLGITTSLMARLGDDTVGDLTRQIITSINSDLGSGLATIAGERSSYSVILSPPSEDRMVLHFAGANDTFTEADVAVGRLEGARIFHFGYPPVMKAMYSDNGEGLLRVMRRARQSGLATALDMAYPDPESGAGQADWRLILRSVLPSVDVFLPSLPEAMLMLDPRRSVAALAGGVDALLQAPVKYISELAAQIIEMGAAIVGIKVGHRGFYIRTGSAKRICAIGGDLALDLQAWSQRELWSSIYEAHLIGTTGAGDATNAGFLLGLLRGMTPEDSAGAACAVGASCVEAADATSGVRSWQETHTRIANGWRRDDRPPGHDWVAGSQQGIWMPAGV